MVFQKSEILKNAVSERWCKDNRNTNFLHSMGCFEGELVGLNFSVLEKDPGHRIATLSKTLSWSILPVSLSSNDGNFSR